MSSNYIYKYCDKCGKVWHGHLDNPNEICGICKNVLKIIPDNYYVDYKGTKFFSKDMEQQLVNDLVLTSPNFDQYFFDHKEEIKAEKDRDYYTKMAHGKAILEEKNRVPKCPICGSTNIKKISFTSRAVKTALFGAVGAIDDAGKTWKCNNCGSRF